MNSVNFTDNPSHNPPFPDESMDVDDDPPICERGKYPCGNNNNNRCPPPPSFKDIGPVIKSPVDTKNYKAIELPNGLKAVLVSTCLHETNAGSPPSSATLQQQVSHFNQKYLGIDVQGGAGKDPCDNKEPSDAGKYQQADDPKVLRCCLGMATACVVIGAGAFHDPPELNGLAHLLEHLVFLGSAKYPEENHLFTEVYKQRGIINAFTQSDHTCFYFSAHSAGFENCLERLTDGIKFPLLKDNSILREVEAVDSEFSIKQTCDMTRVYDFMRTLVQPGHPMGNFYWGNKETLSDKGLCEGLRKWHKSNYVSNRMSVCIHAPVPMKKLEEMVLRNFSDVPSSKEKVEASLLEKYGEPFPPAKFYAMYELESIGQWDWMVINWSLPPTFWQDYESKPLAYIKWMMNTRTPGGLVHLLESKGLISFFASGCSTSDCFYRNEFTAMFGIHLKLTEIGVRLRDRVLAAVFAYIRFIKAHGKLSRCGEEMKRTYATNFHHKNWQELLTSSQEIALTLNKFHTKPGHVLTADGLLMRYSEQALDSCLELLKPRNACFIYASNRLRGMSDLRTAWPCDIKYRKEVLTEENYASFDESDQNQFEFHLPPENAFLSRDIMFEEDVGERSVKNSKVHDSDKVVVEHVSQKKNPCVSSLVPSASYIALFRSPVVHQLPRKEGLLQIWTKLASHRIYSEIFFQFYRLYSFSVDVTDEGISVFVSGPRQNLLELFTVVVNSVFREISPDGDDERCFPEAFKEQLQVYFNDTLDIQSLSEGLLSHLLVDRFTNLFQLYDDLHRFTFDDYSNFLRSYKRKMFVEVELNGSASQADYDGILGVVNGLGYSTCLLMNSYADRGTVIPHGTSVLYLQAGHTAFVTSLVTVHFQLCASADVEEARFAKILFHAMRRRLPQQLRTVEQIGYTARLTLWDEFGSVGFTIMVYTQPTKHSTEHVDSRITTFIRSFYDKYLKTGEIFQKLVAPYVKEKVDFFRCKQFYAGTLLEKGSKCRKLSIHIRGFHPGSQAKSREDAEGGGDAKPLLQYQTIGKQKLEELEKKGIQIIDNLDRFKRNLCLLPAAN